MSLELELTKLMLCLESGVGCGGSLDAESGHDHPKLRPDCDQAPDDGQGSMSDRTNDMAAEQDK